MATVASSEKRQISMITLSFFSLIIGTLTGGGAILLRYLIGLIHNVFFLGEWSFAYDANAPTPPSPFGPFVILAPVVGGLIVLFLVRRFAPEAKGHGVPEVMDAIYYDKGRIRPVVVVIKSLASALSIGSGASVGREGPIIQIGSGIGSVLGQIGNLQSWQVITLVAAGAGAGIAATFNTPLGAVLFAVELMLPEFSGRTLLPVVLATGTATYMGRLAFGMAPAFLVAAHAGPDILVPLSVDMLPLYILAGLITGLGATFFIWTLYKTEDLFDNMTLNPYVKNMIGMAGIGVLMYVMLLTTGMYQTAGVGYATIQLILTGQITAPLMLLVLFLVKMIAMSVSLGAGASGGVFSPSLFIGAALGGAMGAVLNSMFPYLGLNSVTFALLGMAAMVGASTGATLTSIMMIFEMTGDYTIAVAAIIAVVCAVGVRRGLMGDNIYTMKLTRRGHHIPRESRSHLFPIRLIGQVMDPVVGRIPRAAFEAANCTAQVMPVDGRRYGVVMDGSHVMGVVPVSQDDPDKIIGQMLAPIGIVREDAFLQTALGHMAARGHEALIVTRKGYHAGPENMIGVVSRAAVGAAVIRDYRR